MLLHNNILKSKIVIGAFLANVLILPKKMNRDFITKSLIGLQLRPTTREIFLMI
jgi:hypothetical protein